MTQATPFKNDIFISYAHSDNEPLMEGEAGWISEFHQTLEAFIKQISGENVQIWRDPKLQGNDFFSDTLVDSLPETALLVSIVSPRYLKSEWCLRELECFEQGAQSTGGVRVEDKSRIFKVVKTRIARDEQPSPLDQLLGYEFFSIDPATGKPYEFRKEFGPEAKQSYLTKTYETAYEIADLLTTLKALEGNATASAPRPPVYLAETTSDLSEERDRVKTELRQLGHPVLPDRPLPLDSEGLHKAVESYLERSSLAIHLIGEKSGLVPEGERRSVIRIQNAEAARFSRERGLPRLIWMPPGLVATDPRQAKFIEQIQVDEAAQAGADVLMTSLEELKTVVRDRLKEKEEEKPSTPAVEDEDWLQAYLVCDQCDFEATQALSDYLYDRGLEVVFPAFEGDEHEVREDHNDKLATSDLIVLYCGQARDLWLSAKLKDLRKLPGYDRYKPKLATVVYLGPPDTVQKQRFRTREAMVIKAFDEFSASDLEPMMATVDKARTGSA
ncbi:MAG: hypothetical protein U9R74_01350 [Pseudomonadota bacterium]|nr:hypothetical protein [Pseudomonadota bacterium]